MTSNDVPWERLLGGYRLPYDPRPVLQAIETGIGSWNGLWEELHHQGDVDTASYAALPLIANLVARTRTRDWNPFALAVTIDLARLDGHNPALPDWAKEAYEAAWQELLEVAHGLLPDVEEGNLIAALIAVLAIGKNQPQLARTALLDEAERKEMFDELGWG